VAHALLLALSNEGPVRFAERLGTAAVQVAPFA